jgi:hypothetical protein
MNQNPPTDTARHEPADPLDRLLADFFQSQIRQPWPPAPATPLTESAALLALHDTAASSRDYNRKSRYTLAVSVALLLGACWFFSSGFSPSVHSGSGSAPTGGMLKDAGAGKPAAVEELRKDNAIKGDAGGVHKGTSRPPLQFP